MNSEWISSAEAARRLGVSAATLYAYVSRGLLRSEGTTGRRERRYRADDVSRLKRRRAVGRKAESIAANALDFGTPVLESALTLIENLTAPWNPEEYKDEYREALLEIVEKKAAGEQIEAVEAAPVSKVVDLMDALKASVEAVKKEPAAQEKKPARKNPSWTSASDRLGRDDLNVEREPGVPAVQRA